MAQAEKTNIATKEVDVADNNLENFKNLVRKGVRLTKEESVYFNAIPNDVWSRIFEVNFNNNYKYAARIILHRFKEVNTVDKPRVDREKKKIHNLNIATQMIVESINKQQPIFIITDFDNDGSLAQSVAGQYLKIDKEAKEYIHLEYAQAVNGNTNRGLNVDHVALLVSHYGYDKDSEFLIVTADNGINSREEQLKIEKEFPNCKIIITDHHNPEPDMVINERKGRTVIFNPHYKPTEFFKQFNISGATTLGVLLQNVLEVRFSEDDLKKHESTLEVMDKLCRVSNLLDYVNTDPVDKPEKDYVVSRFLKLQPLLNVTNAITRLITDNIDDDTIEAIQKKIPNIDIDLLYKEEKNIKIQNYKAQALLEIARTYEALPVELREQLSGEDFFKEFAEKIADLKNVKLEDFVNTNFIEQLRPYIFTLSAQDDNTEFLNEVNDAMQNVFKELRVSERKISEELRKGEVITRNRGEHSTIIYADPNVLKSFTRKFLNKVYNDENNGFMLTLDSIKPARVSGSFRSTYDISDILKNKKKLEAELKCKIETPGHERAAGFILTAKDPLNHPITDKTIETLNHYINESIGDLKKKDSKAKRDYLLTDFTAVQLIDRINQTIRGNISNFENIKPVLKIDENTVWTDPYTSDLHTMQEIIDKRKFGYVSLNINFSGDTVIVPTELLRRIVKNGYKDYLGLDYMDGGVFMGSRVIEEKNAKSIIDLRNKNHKTEAIIKAWEERKFHKNPVIKLSREEIKDNPFFKYSQYGELNFDLFEQMVIGIIDTNKVDTYTVFDVEAIGFGNAKIINLGAMNYQIDPNSGLKMDKDEFARKFFTNSRGETYLLSDLDISELAPVSMADVEILTPEQRKFLLSNADKRLFSGQDSFEFDVEDEKFFYIPKPLLNQGEENKLKQLPYTRISNFKVLQNEVVYNRTIKAEMSAYLINEDDIKIPAPMTSLTGIDKNILNKYGLSTKEVDENFSKYYEGKNVLFGAHNIPYDGRIFSSNMPLSHEVLKNSKIYDSALFARKEFLAYDNIEVTSFNSKFVIGAKTSTGGQIYFYNNPYSDFNLTNFVLKGENGVYPDRTGNYLLEIENGLFFMVDKIEHKKIKLSFDEAFLNSCFEDIEKAEMELLTQQAIFEEFEKYEGEEYKPNAKEAHKIDLLNIISSNEHAKNPNLPINTRALLLSFVTGPMPGNSVKYSVEKLSEQYMIRSLLLFKEDFKVNYVDLTNDIYSPIRQYAQEIAFFQENYHFDTSPAENIIAFEAMFPHINTKQVIRSEYVDEQGVFVPALEKDLLDTLVNEFLIKNKKIQEKFADAWVYKKVLEFYEPNPNSQNDDFRAFNKDLIDLTHFETAIPKDKIRKIFEEAIEFKKHFKIEHIIQHESHVNGPIDGDIKGDIAFEDKLTLSLLAERFYNSYNHSIERALHTFNYFSLDASLAFDKSNLVNDLAVDSYSYRQALLYEREHKTFLVNKIQGFEEGLENAQRCSIVKFKLDNDILPSKTYYVGVTKSNISLSREQIEKDSEMLSFIALNEQLITALVEYNVPKSKKKLTKEEEDKLNNELYVDMSKTTSLSKKFIDMLEHNRSICFEYKKDLSTRYKFIDYSKRDLQIDSMLDRCIYLLVDQNIEEKILKFQVDSKRLKDIDYSGYQIIMKILSNYVSNAVRLDFDKHGLLRRNLKTIKEYLSKEAENCDTRFEEALVKRNINFDIEPNAKLGDKHIKRDKANPEDAVLSKSFLEKFEINRMKPISMLFDKFNHYRLLNNYVENQMEAQKVSNVRRLKM